MKDGGAWLECRTTWVLRRSCSFIDRAQGGRATRSEGRGSRHRLFDRVWLDDRFRPGSAIYDPEVAITPSHSSTTSPGLPSVTPENPQDHGAPLVVNRTRHPLESFWPGDDFPGSLSLYQVTEAIVHISSLLELKTPGNVGEASIGPALSKMLGQLLGVDAPSSQAGSAAGGMGGGEASGGE